MIIRHTRRLWSTLSGDTSECGCSWNLPNAIYHRYMGHRKIAHPQPPTPISVDRFSPEQPAIRQLESRAADESKHRRYQRYRSTNASRNEMITNLIAGIIVRNGQKPGNEKIKENFATHIKGKFGQMRWKLPSTWDNERVQNI